MQKTKTKKSLLASGLSLLVCVMMLIGSTFAWFTDSVTSRKNVIMAGNLDISATYQDVDMEKGTVSYTVPGFDHVADQTVKFSDKANDINEDNAIIKENLWEPGAVGAKLITVRNDGSLAAKIKLSFDIQDGGLQNALWFDFVQVKDGQAIGQFTQREMSTLTELAALKEYNLMPKDTDGNSISFILFYGMKEEAGNEYMGKSFSADVTILATQYTYEKDGFGEDYDADAMYDNGDGTYTQGEKIYVNVDNNYILVTPNEDVEGLYTDEEENNYVSSGEAVNYVFDQAENGENITFIDDVTFSARGSSPYLTVENATVDLNGKTVTVEKGDNTNAFGVTGNGSVVKNGIFKCGTGRADYPLWITGNTGKNHVTVENVTVEGGMQVTGTVSATLKNVKIIANNYYDVYMAQNSKVTVESGEFTSAGNHPHFYIQNYGSTYNPTIIVNGGSFSGGSPTIGVSHPNNPYTFENKIQ